MSLYESWSKTAYDNTGHSDKKFWAVYMPLEQKIYEDVLENRIERISGTVSELAGRYGLKNEYFIGFVDGIKEAVTNNLDGKIDVESFDENTIVDFTIDFERLYKKMVEYKAKHLYTLPQWEGIFTQEQRDEFFTWQKKSGTYVREGGKIGRNDACPCGSGKKYKKCCGAA